jgi:hypothetical protein
MLEHFKRLAYLGGIVAQTLVLAIRPTLPAAGFSVKEGVIKNQPRFDNAQ